MVGVTKNNMYKYPLAKPDLSGKEKEYVNKALDEGIISSQGSYVQQFEELFAKKHNTKHGIAVSSGTNAIFLALKALGIGEGDEVIVPDFTMVATAWAVTYTGAKPVFVDCEWDGNIDPYLLEEKITPKTKAIIPVHIYGRKCRMDAINEIAKQYNLKVVEDSCEAHGVPPTSSIACYSLYANKIITSGEGGICLTNDDNLAFQLRHLRNMSIGENKNFYHTQLGYNFRMTNLQGAVALAQTERLEEFIEKRKQIEKWYDDKLNKFATHLVCPRRDVLWMYDIRTDKRDELMEYLKADGIETRMAFKPMTIQPMYRERANIERKALWLSNIGMYLPTYTQLEEKDVEFICNKINGFFNKEENDRK